MLPGLLFLTPRGAVGSATPCAEGTTPANGLLVQGAIALALIAFGAVTRDGFKAMVDYTSGQAPLDQVLKSVDDSWPSS